MYFFNKSVDDLDFQIHQLLRVPGYDHYYEETIRRTKMWIQNHQKPVKNVRNTLVELTPMN